MGSVLQPCSLRSHCRRYHRNSRRFGHYACRSSCPRRRHHNHLHGCSCRSDGCRCCCLYWPLSLPQELARTVPSRCHCCHTCHHYHGGVYSCSRCSDCRRYHCYSHRSGRYSRCPSCSRCRHCFHYQGCSRRSDRCRCCCLLWPLSQPQDLALDCTPTMPPLPNVLPSLQWHRQM